MKKAGLRQITFHDLRHSGAMYRVAVSIESIEQVEGVLPDSVEHETVIQPDGRKIVTARQRIENRLVRFALSVAVVTGYDKAHLRPQRKRHALNGLHLEALKPALMLGPHVLAKRLHNHGCRRMSGSVSRKGSEQLVTEARIPGH
jgi:hypothetical protein